jgi:hypothetical protein
VFGTTVVESNTDAFEVEVTLRPTVCLGVRRPSGIRDQFYFLLEYFFRQLRFCSFVAPSLTRGRVCNLLVQLLLGFARAVTLGSKSCRTHGHILLSHMRLPQPGGPGSRIYISQEQGDPIIPPGTVTDAFASIFPSLISTSAIQVVPIQHEICLAHFHIF